jgi:hypothetical protein
MRPTVEDLQAIWLFTYSRSSLFDAAHFLAALSEVVPELGKAPPNRSTIAHWLRRQSYLTFDRSPLVFCHPNENGSSRSRVFHHRRT